MAKNDNRWSQYVWDLYEAGPKIYSYMMQLVLTVYLVRLGTQQGRQKIFYIVQKKILNRRM